MRHIGIIGAVFALLSGCIILQEKPPEATLPNTTGVMVKPSVTPSVKPFEATVPSPSDTPDPFRATPEPTPSSDVVTEIGGIKFTLKNITPQDQVRLRPQDQPKKVVALLLEPDRPTSPYDSFDMDLKLVETTPGAYKPFVVKGAWIEDDYASGSIVGQQTLGMMTDKAYTVKVKNILWEAHSPRSITVALYFQMDETYSIGHSFNLFVTVPGVSDPIKTSFAVVAAN